jgi:hypothetical protein
MAPRSHRCVNRAGRISGAKTGYDSLWIYAKRHYDLGIGAYWKARMDKELRNALVSSVA